MSIFGQYEAPPMTEPQRRDAMADMTAIVRGEELDLPWRRIRVLPQPPPSPSIGKSPSGLQAGSRSRVLL